MRMLGEILDEVVPEVCGDLSLEDMWPCVQTWVFERDGCWIDRRHEGSGVFAQVSRPGFGGNVVVPTRRATMISAGIEWKPGGRYSTTCGERSCVHPHHQTLSKSLRIRRRAVERVSWRNTEEMCRIVSSLMRRGFRPSDNDHNSYTRNREFRVMFRPRVVEFRDRSNVVNERAS